MAFLSGVAGGFVRRSTAFPITNVGGACDIGVLSNEMKCSDEVLRQDKMRKGDGNARCCRSGHHF